MRGSPSNVVAVGGLIPRFGKLTLPEAELLLQGLYLVDLLQLQQGVPGISTALRRGGRFHTRILRYIRRDPREHWRTIRELWLFGGGDCEDLAAAIAAELTFSGVPARPRLMHVRPGLVHAVVEILSTGELVDPSKVGGMGEA